MKILVFGFSLRKESFSKAIADACKELAPEGVEISLYSISDIPIFNQDLEQKMPDPVSRFKDAIRKSDGILIVMPEYNYSVPGYLKNAIDFASRPHTDNVFDGKPVGIISESIGMLGGSRAQYHLRQSLLYLNANDMKKPEVFVSFVNEKIKDGRLVDEAAREYIFKYLVAFKDFISGSKKRIGAQ
ncbi:MAG: NAD(P)H-dependent oxidoreductase [Candidatus Micrarchaeaceae archaeon]